MNPAEHYVMAEDLAADAWEETDMVHRDQLLRAAQVHATLALFGGTR